MVEINEVLISDIHAAALTDKAAYELDSERTEVSEDLPDGVYPVSISVRLDRAQRNDREDANLRPPRYPATVKRPDDNSPYIPDTTVWVENPAIVENRGGKIWDHQKFTTNLVEEIKKIETEDPQAPARFYLTGMKLVEIVDKSYLIEDKIGRMRPEAEFFEDHGEMSIAHFTKRPTITNETVKKKLREKGAMSGQVKQPLRLTRFDRVWAKPHMKADTTRRFWTPGQAENQPGIEVANVRPRSYKLREEITEADDETTDNWNGWIVQELRTGTDDIETYFPQLSASSLWLKCKFIGDYDSTEQFRPTDVVFDQPVATT